MTAGRESLFESRDPWELTRRFFEQLAKLRAEDPNPKLYRFKDSVLDEDGYPKRCRHTTQGDGSLWTWRQ